MSRASSVPGVRFVSRYFLLIVVAVALVVAGIVALTGAYPHLSLIHILLRQEIARQSPLGKRVQSIISQGHLVDDDTIIDLIALSLIHICPPSSRL